MNSTQLEQKIKCLDCRFLIQPIHNGSFLRCKVDSLPSEGNQGWIRTKKTCPLEIVELEKRKTLEEFEKNGGFKREEW